MPRQITRAPLPKNTCQCDRPAPTPDGSCLKCGRDTEPTPRQRLAEIRAITEGAGHYARKAA